jgi:hypothetical protein
VTLEDRLSAALARRGRQRLGTVLMDALSLRCVRHVGDAFCALKATDDETVERLERYADEIANPRSDPYAPTPKETP